MQWVMTCLRHMNTQHAWEDHAWLHQHCGSAAQGSPTQVPTNTREEKWRYTMATPMDLVIVRATPHCKPRE